MNNYKSSKTFGWLMALCCLWYSLAEPSTAQPMHSYSSDKPLSEPTIFASGVIPTGDFDSHPAFTPEGETLYFVRSTPNFNHWTILVSRFVRGRWSTPEVAPFSGRYSDADPFITRDGSRFYFISNRPVEGKSKPDLDVWEAQFLAAVISAAPRNERVLWGLDRELFSDRYLISKLEARVPGRAGEPFTRLKEASTNAWARHQQNPSPENLFIFSQDPAVVSAVRAAWLNPDRESDTILRTLEESLAINAVARTGSAWASSQRRAQWMRNNLASRLREERGPGSPPKVMLKFGYNHMIRGANYFNVFDVGAMTNEVATLSGGRAFHILVLAGPGSRQAVLGPGRSFVSVSSDEFDEFRTGDQRLTRVLSNANATGHEVVDLRALRPLAMRGLEGWNADVVRTIHGYDAAVIWKGAHASSALR